MKEPSKPALHEILGMWSVLGVVAVAPTIPVLLLFPPGEDPRYAFLYPVWGLGVPTLCVVFWYRWRCAAIPRVTRIELQPPVPGYAGVLPHRLTVHWSKGEPWEVRGANTVYYRYPTGERLPLELEDRCHEAVQQRA